MLNSVELNLIDFRNDLASVSADIESLQERSAALNRRLQNRKDVEKALGPVVEELSVSPEVVSKISMGQLDESWVQIICELDRRTVAYDKKITLGTRPSRASAELGPLLEKLTLKVRWPLATCHKRYEYLRKTYADTNIPERLLNVFEISLWPR